MEPLKIDLKLVNGKVKFLGTSERNPALTVAMDYVPPLGDDEGFLGLELLVASFAGCVSTAIVGLLRRMGKTVDGYAMRASGFRRETPLALEKIEFEVDLKSPDVAGDELEAVIRRAQTISPVWLALHPDIAVTWRQSVSGD